MEPNEKKALYFAHPVNTYDTPLELAVISLIEMIFPYYRVDNPNQPHHQVGYTKFKERTAENRDKHKGMNYFFDVVLPGDHGCVALPFLDGRMGLGVNGEVKWFIQQEPQRPVWIVRLNKEFTPEALDAFIKNPKSGLFWIHGITDVERELVIAEDPKLVVPHIETRIRTWTVYNLEKRPYATAHLVGSEVPPGFYPEDKK